MCFVLYRKIEKRSLREDAMVVEGTEAVTEKAPTNRSHGVVVVCRYGCADAADGRVGQQTNPEKRIEGGSI